MQGRATSRNAVRGSREKNCHATPDRLMDAEDTSSSSASWSSRARNESRNPRCCCLCSDFGRESDNTKNLIFDSICVIVLRCVCYIQKNVSTFYWYCTDRQILRVDKSRNQFRNIYRGGYLLQRCYMLYYIVQDIYCKFVFSEWCMDFKHSVFHWILRFIEFLNRCSTKLWKSESW